MKKFFSLFAAMLMAGSLMAQFDTWSVVGSKAIMNGTADWAIAETANDMTTEDGVTYTLTVTGKTLEVGTTYEYKYAKGHAWAVSIPQSGNLSLTVAETAVYDIVYTVNVSEKTHSAVATKAGEAGEISHVYSIAGSSADLFGAAWSQTATATEMTKGEDGIYSWTKENVELTAATIEYKVVVDHAWGEAYPSQNATLVIAEAAAYDVVITFNPADKAVNATATKVGGEGPVGPGPEPTYNYYLAGTMTDWSSTGMEGDSIVLHLEAGEHGFKVQLVAGYWDNALGFSAVNAECSSEGLTGNNDGNVCFTLDEAGDVIIRIVEGQICVSGAFSTPEPTLPEVDLKGINNDWVGVAMVAAEDKLTCSYTYSLEAGDYAFKLYIEGAWLGNNGTMTRDNCSGWTMDASAGNCGLTADVDGDYTFTYEYASGKLSVTYPSYIPTGVENSEKVEIKKMIVNSQLVIVRDGKCYNAQGMQL